MFWSRKTDDWSQMQAKREHTTTTQMLTTAPPSCLYCFYKYKSWCQQRSKKKKMRLTTIKKKTVSLVFLILKHRRQELKLHAEERRRSKLHMSKQHLVYIWACRAPYCMRCQRSTDRSFTQQNTHASIAFALVSLSCLQRGRRETAHMSRLTAKLALDFFSVIFVKLDYPNHLYGGKPFGGQRLKQDEHMWWDKITGPWTPETQTLIWGARRCRRTPQKAISHNIYP